MPFSDFTQVFLSSHFLLLLLLLGPEIVMKIHRQQLQSVAVVTCAQKYQAHMWADLTQENSSSKQFLMLFKLRFHLDETLQQSLFLGTRVAERTHGSTAIVHKNIEVADERTQSFTRSLNVSECLGKKTPLLHLHRRKRNKLDK